MSYRVWGWGDAEPTRSELEALAPLVQQVVGVAAQEPETTSPLPELPAPRIAVPAALVRLASTEPADRARHGLGRAYRDLVRGLRGKLDHVPDAVLRPASEQDVVDVLDWAGSTGTAVIPYGGGTSVVGGVEPRGLERAVSLDLGRLQGLLDVDPVSRSVLLAAGTLGPDAEEHMKQHGLTLRFYPQSFERSTVGGWVATRAGGHFATGPTHIDDLVESVRAVTPTGIWESRRLPASGAGPSPDRLLLGSEGALGVITQVWLRAQPRPVHRWAATLAAPSFLEGAAAVRELVQAGVAPAACRLLDPVEATVSGALATGEAVLVLGLESLGAPVDARFAMDVLQSHGLRVLSEGARGESGEAWRSTFVRAPHLRDQLVMLGVLAETFETAVTWDRFEHLVTSVTGAVEQALTTVAGAGRVGVRLTHVYPDGCAPYFTVLAPARRGSEVAQWDELKAAASDALAAAGGTITHHHAVGRDHRPWYDGQRPAPFARALQAAKREVDPRWVLNPGVLLPLP